jgi:putative nucleotidyltransferase with HDIG domain
MDQMSVGERALILHRDEAALAELAAALRAQLPCDTSLTDADALNRLGASEYRVVVLDHQPPRHSAEPLLRAALERLPEALIVVMTPSLEVARGFEERSPGKVYRFLGGPDRKWELCGFVAQGLRLGRLEREQRELVRKLGNEYNKLQRREKLLDQVVRERTRSLETAYLQLKAANRQLLLGMAEVIEAKDAYTKGHCGRVAAYSLQLARAADYPEADLETLEYAAFLHDIGKVGVRDAVLQKPGPLGEAEWTHMRIHPVVGDSIASQIELLKPLRPAIRNHHERWDGQGYPDKMKGEEIPIDARIVCIADAWDAMITDRPYKDALPLDQCYGFLRKGQGKQFDPRLVDLFIEHRIGEDVA